MLHGRCSQCLPASFGQWYLLIYLKKPKLLSSFWAQGVSFSKKLFLCKFLFFHSSQINFKTFRTKCHDTYIDDVVAVVCYTCHPFKTRYRHYCTHKTKETRNSFIAAISPWPTKIWHTKHELTHTHSRKYTLVTLFTLYYDGKQLKVKVQLMQFSWAIFPLVKMSMVLAVCGCFQCCAVISRCGKCTHYSQMRS